MEYTVLLFIPYLSGHETRDYVPQTQSSLTPRLETRLQLGDKRQQEILPTNVCTGSVFAIQLMLQILQVTTTT